MKWKIKVSKSANKFIDKNSISDGDLFSLIQKTIRYLKGEDINVDINKLTGEWKGFFRIRAGKLRVIVEIDFDNLEVFIEEIDWRGNVYN